MTILKNIVRVDIKAFTIIKATKTICSELSTVFGHSRPFSRIYDDAVDEGLVLVNSRTGIETIWVISAEKLDEQGNLEIHLKPESRCTPAQKEWTMILFND